MADQKLFMIGHAHIDPVWLWQWQEGFQEVKATFRSALDRMNEYEDFKFISSSALFYHWVEENDPEMFQEIKDRIAEGRWEIVGGWWIEPDCNIPGGESFVRQGLYGQRYFQAKFGKTAKVGFNADSFGHHAMLPQILLKSELDYYVFMRPMPNEMGLPGRLFMWEAPDGSRIPTFRIPYEYCTWKKDIENHVRRVAAEIKAPFSAMMCFYGVGNHGGGPTKENIASIHRLQQVADLPELQMSTTEDYFRYALQKSLPLPVVHDELQHHASGCYSVHSGIKKWNRDAENRLLRAEKFSILAHWLTGQPYPREYEQAWKNVLFNQFHDILAGTSLEETYEDARNMLGEAISIADRGLNYALQSLSWKIDIEEMEGMKPVVVFNPHGWPVKINVEVEIGSSTTELTLLNDANAEVPMQLVQSHATADGRRRVSFIADLPALGYRVYKIVPKCPTKSFAWVETNITNGMHTTSVNPDVIACHNPEIDKYTMENQRYRLTIDRETGFISSFLDKEKEFEIFKKPAARPVVLEDNSDTWSHNVFSYRTELASFKAEKVYLAEHGPVKSVLRVVSKYNNSRMVQDFTMYPDLPQIDVQVTLDWHEERQLLKLKFPVNLFFRKATYEIPFGFIERPVNGEEEPGQGWFDITGIMPDKNEIYGLSILNNGKYSYDILNQEMSLTVLRSPIYAHHDPALPKADQVYSYIDHGRQKFQYTLLPHRDSWESAGTVQRTAELNQPPIVLVETYHKGSLPQMGSYLLIEPENIVLSALKKAEDNDDMILRCYETAGIATEAKICLPAWGREINTNFNPLEIKTFRIPREAGEAVVETNLLEW